MDEQRPFAGDPADSREAIMRATFVALQEHGYAGLSIQRIADQADLSKSTFYHHFEDRDDLLLSFAKYMLEQFVTVLSLEAGDSPRETLETIVDIVLAEDFPSVQAGTQTELDEWDILRAYVEVRAQAVQNEAFRTAFTEMDEVLHARITDVVEAGIDTGEFREVDGEHVASLVLTVLGGHMFGVATSNGGDVDAVRIELEQYLEARLYSAE